MARPRRILILASLAASLVNFRGPLIAELLAAGHEVHAAAPALHADPATLAWLSARGVRAHDIALARTGTNPMADLGALWGLYRLMRRLRPDLVLAYTIKPVIWGMIAAWMARVPQRVALITGLGYAFVGEHGGRRGLVRKVVGWLAGFALGRAGMVVFQNPDDPADLRRWGILRAGARIAVVNGSGVDARAFAHADLPPGAPHFLLIARLLGDKGIREYAAAAGLLRSRYPGAEFHLVGPIDSNPEAITRAELDAWQRAGDLVWQGPLADVRPAIAGAHVFVLPSFYREGLPRTILEAMAMGRPIITTDTPGCRETVREGENGYLVPMRNAPALAEAMERFLREPGRIAAMGAQSRQIALERFEVRKVNAQMLAAMGL